MHTTAVVLGLACPGHALVFCTPHAHTYQPRVCAVNGAPRYRVTSVTLTLTLTGGHYNNPLDRAGALAKWWSAEAVEGKLPLTNADPNRASNPNPCVNPVVSPVTLTLTQSLTLTRTRYPNPYVVTLTLTLTLRNPHLTLRNPHRIQHQEPSRLHQRPALVAEGAAILLWIVPALHCRIRHRAAAGVSPPAPTNTVEYRTLRRVALPPTHIPAHPTAPPLISAHSNTDHPSLSTSRVTTAPSR